MAGEVYEWFGYRTDDHSDAARESAHEQSCPYVPGPCTKAGGACSLRLGVEVIPVCPKRLYFEGHRFIRQIASEIFDHLGPNLAADGLPSLVPGSDARAAASSTGLPQVGLFGREGWGSEVRLPAGVEGGARYSVDYTIICVSADGDLLGFAPVEVQTIDTTGNYQASLEALRDGRRIEVSRGLGLNWENVSKRILPQLITKGLILQGERLCASGLFFVTPEAVFQRIMTRLGGVERFRHIPMQPGSITFVRYQLDPVDTTDGDTVNLQRMDQLTISTSDMSLAFITPQNLAGAGAYEATIVARL